jgi:hypothetical protein
LIVLGDLEERGKKKEERGRKKEERRKKEEGRKTLCASVSLCKPTFE